MPDNSGLQVFLCHAQEDKDKVRDLYKWLSSKGHRPWLDELSIPPGRNWLLAIQEAIQGSHVILVCLSSNSVRKHGVVQREIKLALEAATERPGDEIFIIPCRLEECDIPIGLKHWQWVDLFKREGRRKLENSLALCLATLPPVVNTEIESDERPPEESEGDGWDEAMAFVMSCAGTAARNTVNKILQGYEVRRGRVDHVQLVEWLVSSIKEGYSQLDNLLPSLSRSNDDEKADDFITTRFKGAAVGAKFAAHSFERVISQIQEFFEFESKIEDREEYVLARLQAILNEWESYDIDEWAAENRKSN